jgi:hypothetical protein
MQAADSITEVTKQEAVEGKRDARDLTICPADILALDPNARVLWVKFLRRTGIPMSAKSKKGKNVATDLWVDNNCRRAAVIRSFGIPSLVQRLTVCKSEVERARVWWRESAACAGGDSVPDLSSENLFLLNPFIVTKELRFEDTRFKTIATSAPLSVEEQRLQNTRKLIQRARAGRKASQTTKTAAVAA